MKFIKSFLGCLGIVTLLSISANAQAVLLNSDGNSAASAPIEEVHSHTISSSLPQNFQDAWALRSERRVGVGSVVGGPTGLLGVATDLNFTPETSVGISFGGGSGFQAFSLQVKRTFDGTYLVPYLAAGYARWYSSHQSGPLRGSTPGFLHDRFLSADERTSGDFGENIVYPTAGLQYLQLSGPYTGTSVFVEVSALLDLNRFVMEPTTSVGAMYYF